MKSVHGKDIYVFGEVINLFALVVYIHDRRRERISCSSNPQHNGYQFNTDSHKISMTSRQKKLPYPTYGRPQESAPTDKWQVSLRSRIKCTFGRQREKILSASGLV